MSLFALANEIEEGIQPIEMEEGNHKTIMSISLVYKPYQNWENVLKKSLRIIGCRISFFWGAGHVIQATTLPITLVLLPIFR